MSTKAQVNLDVEWAREKAKYTPYIDNELVKALLEAQAVEAERCAKLIGVGLARTYPGLHQEFYKRAADLRRKAKELSGRAEG